MMIVAVRLRVQVHSRVRLLCFRSKVEDIQEMVNRECRYKQLMFLTISQSIPEPSCSRSVNSSAIPCLVGQDANSSGQAESIFTEDLQTERSGPSTATPYAEPRADNSSGQAESIFTEALQIERSGPSTATPYVEPRADNSSGQAESIFTEDLQIERSGPSTTTPYVEPRADISSGQTDIIFTEDLQINWSAVTAERLEQISQELRR